MRYSENQFIPELTDELKTKVMKERYALPFRQYAYPGDFNTYEFPNIVQNLSAIGTMTVTVRIKEPSEGYKPKKETKLKKLRDEGLDVTKMLCSGVLSKEMRQSILAEILGEENGTE